MFGNQECSSGCESGWTLYLQHSSVSPDDASYDRELDSPNRAFTKRSNDEEEDEDEDLSMVSDASSGPRHLHEEEEEGYDKNGCGFYPYAIEEPSPRNINSLTRKKKRENRCRNKAQQHSSLLDDTASSPFLNLCHVRILAIIFHLIYLFIYLFHIN